MRPRIQSDLDACLNTMDEIQLRLFCVLLHRISRERSGLRLTLAQCYARSTFLKDHYQNSKPQPKEEPDQCQTPT